jgi:hypothetical protein
MFYLRVATDISMRNELLTDNVSKYFSQLLAILKISYERREIVQAPHYFLASPIVLLYHSISFCFISQDNFRNYFHAFLTQHLQHYFAYQESILYKSLIIPEMPWCTQSSSHCDP